MNFPSILVAIIIFLFVVLFHEGGHFIAAKSVGIKVNEFAVGMGPAILKKQRGETLYSLRALPLGGFCAMEGEEEETDDPRGYDRAKPWQRFITIFAGPFMNLVIAWICFTLFLGMAGKQVPVIDRFSDNSVLQTAGLEIGDELLSINGNEIVDYDNMTDLIQKYGEKDIEIEYKKTDGSINKVAVKPYEENGQYYVGIVGKSVPDFSHAFVDGMKMSGRLFGQLFDILGRLFTGKLSLNAVSGPIGVIKTIGDATKEGLGTIIFFAGYISLNLAFFNLLPIPALDGSKLLFIIIEKFRGKPINKEIENRITIAGFIFLMGLIVVVSIKDIINIF